MPLILLFIIIIIILVISSSSSTDRASYRGKIGESNVNQILIKFFRYKHYYLFSDIIIKLDDDTTQVDHVLICKNGIFVIETKNYSGWIFGNEKDK